MLWGCSSVTGTGRLVRIEGEIDAEKFKAILSEKALQSAYALRLGRRFTFQGVNDPKQTSKKTQKWLPENCVKDLKFGPEPWRASLEKPGNGCAQMLSPSHLVDLEQFCQGEWEKLPKERCAKLVGSFPRRLDAVKTLQKLVFALSLWSIVCRLMRKTWIESILSLNHNKMYQNFKGSELSVCPVHGAYHWWAMMRWGWSLVTSNCCLSMFIQLWFPGQWIVKID